MPEAGQLRVRMWRQAAAATGQWLLDPEHEWDSNTATAQRLARQLNKSALKRGQAEEFILLIDRSSAQWFCDVVDGICRSNGHVPRLIRIASSFAKEALTFTRGRPSLTQMERQRSIALRKRRVREDGIDAGYLKRMNKLDRAERALFGGEAEDAEEFDRLMEETERELRLARPGGPWNGDD